MKAVLLSLTILMAPPGETYRALFLRAAPGRLVELIDLVQRAQTAAPADERGIVLRHAQGDQWDLMVLAPIGSLARYFGKEHETGGPVWDRLVAWQEELFTTGPAAADLRAAAEKAGYFHLEIFQALAGKRDSLAAERNMENAFLSATAKPVNFVFTRLAGASWDLFTVGFYRDLQHYAEPASVPPDREEAAARAAGFESRSAIGPYLRRFINAHHDTIGGIVR